MRVITCRAVLSHKSLRMISSSDVSCQVDERVRQAPAGDRTVVVENVDVPAGEVRGFCYISNWYISNSAHKQMLIFSSVSRHVWMCMLVSLLSVGFG